MDESYFYQTTKPSDIACDAIRRAIRCLLERCAEKERDLFWRCFPKGIDHEKQAALESGLALIQRTLNQKVAVPA